MELSSPERLKAGSSAGRSDVWALGCIFLELLLWFFNNKEGLDKFYDDRKAEVEPDGELDRAPFCRMQDGEAVLTEAVKSRLFWLREEASGKQVLEDLVRLIETHLLVIDPAKRFSAPDICSRLKGLLIRARKSLDEKRKDFFDVPSKGDVQNPGISPSTTGARTDIGDVDDVGQALQANGFLGVPGPAPARQSRENEYSNEHRTANVLYGGGAQFDPASES